MPKICDGRRKMREAAIVALAGWLNTQPPTVQREVLARLVEVCQGRLLKEKPRA